jgi:hypothetical protein
MSDQELEFQVGVYDGHAVAYCPQTGQVGYEPLRSRAQRMIKSGALVVPPGDHAALLDELDHADDRPAVGGKVAKKLAKVAKKVVKVAKTVATSKLGKAVTMAASFGTSSAAASVAKMAISKAKALAKKAKAKPKGKEAKAAPVAVALSKGKITPKQATAKAKKLGVAPKIVKQAALALKIQTSAKKGSPKAKQLITESAQVDQAKANPTPLTAPPESLAPSPEPASMYEEQEAIDSAPAYDQLPDATEEGEPIDEVSDEELPEESYDEPEAEEEYAEEEYAEEYEEA